MSPQLDRRLFLRGLGVGIAVPVFETFLPKSEGGKAFATTESGMPLRTAFLYKPNGVNVSRWTPTGEGKDYQLNLTHEPYSKYQGEFNLISNLKHEGGTSGGDGGGDHARANASFLTGVRPRKTAGADIKLGISVDQVIANQIGDMTRFSSLELSCDPVRKSGVCDSGYSCAYQYNLSWRSATTPMTPESNPRHVFERLFGAGLREEREKSFAVRNEQQRSILDFVMEDAKAMNRQLGRNDQLKLDEYMTGVREIERCIERAEKFGLPEDPGVPAPESVPDAFEDRVRLMMDMLVLAFETDSTRVASFLLSHDGSNRSFREIGVPEGHHALSHHQRDPKKLEKLAKIDLFYSRQFAYFIEQMQSKKDPDGKSLLYNSQVVWGSGLEDPDRHQHYQLPIIQVGQAGGSIETGSHLVAPIETPMTNLFLSMMDRVGMQEERIGDSTGRLAVLS